MQQLVFYMCCTLTLTDVIYTSSAQSNSNNRSH